MERFISDIYTDADLQIITPDDNYHYFFGYYDMRATGINGKHLAHRVSFWDRLPTAKDIAELGYLENGCFHKFAETTAWNFQQGAMLQYHPYQENTVYYNVCQNGKFMTCTHNYLTGEKQYTDRATACISPDGKWGLAINFGRIYDFRPGYGYAGFKDMNSRINAPDDDGVFLVDMQTGKSKLLLRYSELWKEAGFSLDDKILINHITFNTASDKFVMLVRSFPKPKEEWLTSAVIGDLSGKIRTMCKRCYFSHYWWTDEAHVLAHSSVDGQKTRIMHKFSALDGSYQLYDMPYFHTGEKPDIHCQLSPNGEYIIGDGYPINDYQHIAYLSLKTGKTGDLLKVYSSPNISGDIRCDLHARFIWGGKALSFDTTQNGKRQIAVIPTKNIMQCL